MGTCVGGEPGRAFGAPAPSVSKATEPPSHSWGGGSGTRAAVRAAWLAEVEPVQWESVSGYDVEDSGRAAQVLLIFKNELFLPLQFGCSARHDISPPLLSRPPLLLLVLLPTEGRLVVAAVTMQPASSCSELKDNLEM